MAKSIIIFSITSDIGLNVAKFYYKKNFKVYGTYRKKDSLNNLKKHLPGSFFYKCDGYDPRSIDLATEEILNEIDSWDLLISCPCTTLPIEKFADSNMDQWESSFYLNSLSQLRFLNKLLKKRRKSNKKDFPMVLFFAGGGTNSPVDSFSAYTSAKIHLIKMIEFLAFEDRTTKYCIIGPGWTNTKTHLETLNNCKKNSKKFNEVKLFLENPENGTKFEDINKCIDWLYKKDLDLVTGRNFSVVHDPWQGQSEHKLSEILKNDPNFFKLRRIGNNTDFA